MCEIDYNCEASYNSKILDLEKRVNELKDKRDILLRYKELEREYKYLKKQISILEKYLTKFQ
jgi:hypothetical protein